ncbi:hypothetical protein ACSBR2_017660 [Camellia fascicularis]
MNLLKLLFWNCCGAGNKIFKHNLVEIIPSHKPEILILMETKVAFCRMGNFFNRLGFTTSTIVDPVGRVSGFWIVWYTNHVNVRASPIGSQALHATVLVAVYASPNPTLKEELWNELEEVVNNMEKSWLVAGDFNDYTSQNERRSFSINQSSTRS